MQASVAMMPNGKGQEKYIFKSIHYALNVKSMADWFRPLLLITLNHIKVINNYFGMKAIGNHYVNHAMIKKERKMKGYGI